VTAVRHLVLALVGLLAAEPEAATGGPRVEAWAGHQVLKGKRKIPIYGDKETHTENFLIAEIRRSEHRIEILQKLCRTAVRPIKGVTASMRRESVLRLPKSHIDFDVKADNTLVAKPWTTGWEAEDIDADGSPGATVQIAGSKCAGEVYVTNQTTTRLVSGRATEDGITADIAVQVKQKILGATGLCLKLMAGDSDESQIGQIAYRRVPIGTSCRTLATQPWPVHVELADAKAN
jgi:hypothetical protein